MKTSKKTLYQNTFFLYILTFSNQILNLITVPYQTRILGPEAYGKIGFASAMMIYFQMIMDFGFILSATEDVSRYRDDSEELSKIFLSVSICKCFLAAIVFIVIILISQYNSQFLGDFGLLVLYFFVAFTTTLLPDFLYRGLELMKMITIRSVCIKTFFTIMIFFALKEPSDCYWIPGLTLIGNTVALLFVYWHIRYRLQLCIRPISIRYLYGKMKRSALFFTSRIASTVYGTMNTVVLKYVYPTGTYLGYYTSSDKLIVAARAGFSPICDSLFPYMVRTKDYRLIKRIIFWGAPIITIGTLLVGYFATEFCELLFGAEFAQSANVLRALLPLIPIDFVSYIVAFPLLAPLGKTKEANYSNVMGAMMHLCLFVMLTVTDKLNIYSICFATCATEAAVCAYRILVALRALLNEKGNQS